MSTQDQIHNALQALKPAELNIRDDSHLHVGHAGNTGGGHYAVFIVSEKFAGLPLIKRHRMVFDCVGDLMHEQIHALSIDAKTPAETQR